MSWESVYLFCFCVGLGLTALSLAGGFHHHGHFGHGAHAHGGILGRAMAAVNGFTLTAFLCWFGGTGYLLERYGGLATLVILAFALLSGLAGAVVIFWFLARVMAPHDRELTAEETEMMGVIGRVSGTIRGEGTGEILFSQNGARRFSPARSENGEPIARDTEVVVMRYERGVAFVRSWDDVSSADRSQT
jgi:membrane protein implicated in regulation of membrane protease activity